MNNNTDIFKLHNCIMDRIFIDEQQEYIVGLDINNTIYAVKLNPYEGTILTFVDSGCFGSAHIHTIHQVLLKFNKNIGYTLSRVIIEAKYGDVFYCRLHWASDREGVKDIYNIIGLGDALILASISEADIAITDFVLQQLETIDSDGGFMHIYED